MKKGFTLIELLIVIAVLGILAAGILAIIDPFEQFKKARDTNARNSVVELYNAFIRFNANHGYWPWNYSGSTDICSPTATSETLTSAAGQGCISSLIRDGELKQGFAGAVSSGVITSGRYNFLSSEGNVAVCFSPDSKTIRSDTNTKYDAYGLTASDCPNATSGTCYWCAR